MKLKKFSWLLLLIAAMPYLIFAEEKKTFTLEESIAFSLKQNPEFKMAEKEVAKAKAGVLEAWSNILPQIDGSLNFSHAWDIQQQTIPNFLKPMLAPLAPYMPELQMMPDYVTMSFGLENTLYYGASLAQPVFLGGAGIAGIQMAGSGRQAAEQNLEEVKQNLIYNTTNAFYGCLLARELVKVQEEAFDQTRANLDNVVKKFNVGSASGFDKMRAEVELANLKPELITAKNNYKSALTMFKTVLGLSRESEVELDGKFEYVEDDFGKMELDELQKLAFQHRPLIKALENQKRISKKGITIARSNFLPKMFFQTDYSFMLMKNDYKFRHAEASKGFTSAISLQIPLFHSFNSAAQYQRSKLDYKIILDTEKQAYDGVSAEIEVAYNKFNEAKEKYLSAVQTVELAKEALRLANMMYDEGVNTQLDVLNSQLALTQAKLNNMNSLFEYQSARYHLRKVVGLLKGILDK